MCDAFDLPPGAKALVTGVVGRPGWHATCALTLEGTVAGMALAYRQGREAGLVGGATAPRFRRQGAQAAMMAHRLDLALEQGCTRVLSETGEAAVGTDNPSLNNMLRAGFRVVGRCINFAPGEMVWDHGRKTPIDTAKSD